MPAGLSGNGWLGMAFEVTKGTFVDAAKFMPIISEDLKYTEARYVSPQIRQSTIASDVKQGYYHVEGSVKFEVDVNYLPYILYSTRHTIVKTGSSAPWTYTFVPSGAGSTSTGTGAVQRTLSLTAVRNDVGFGYAGCTMGQLEFMIEDGVLMCTAQVLGQSEAEPVSLPTPTWAAPALFGADAHSVFVDTSGTTPTFATASVDFNGYTFRANFNAEAQNRIVADRAASYISFGETIINVETELDFIDRTEYDKFVATDQMAIRLESLRGGANFAGAAQAVRVDVNRAFYETYDIGLQGIGDLIMAGVTARGIGIAGGDAYKITVKSPLNIT